MFSFAHLNARSLFTDFALFQDHVMLYDYSIIGVSETWLHNGIPDSAVDITNYSIVRQDRATRAGGVAVYIKSDIEYSTILIESKEFIEQIWLKTKISNKVLIIALYTEHQILIHRSFSYIWRILL